MTLAQRRWLACAGLQLIILWPLGSRAQNIINTIAGGGSPLGTGNPLTASLGYPEGVVKDAVGNIYVSSRDARYVLKIDTKNQITILAGTGFAGFSGVGGPANKATLSFPTGLALDGTGSNLFIADSVQVFEVNLSSGVLTDLAGSKSPANPSGGFGGDGGPASQALLNMPQGVAVSGNTVYIADAGNNRIRAVAGGTITTFAGNGNACTDPTTPCGDGGAATSANLTFPRGVAVDGSGNVYVADTNDRRVRKIDNTGAITTVAGNGFKCSTFPCGDGGPATDANLNSPAGIFVDSVGNLYIADNRMQTVRFVAAASQNISTVAGSGGLGFSGDGGQATLATLSNPTGVFVDSGGNILIADQSNDRIRQVNTNQVISTIVGGGSGGDGGTALNSVYANAFDLVLDPSSNQFIIDRGANRVREVAAGSQVVTTVVGSDSGIAGSGGDGGPATSATMHFPEGLAINQTNGDLFVADTINQVVRSVQGGVINTYAGTLGSPCNTPALACGDGGPAASAQLNTPIGVAVDSNGKLFIADTSDNRIRVVDPVSSNISTAAGSGNPCPTSTSACGDGGPATLADLTGPVGVAVDSLGNVFVADSGDNRIRRIDAVTHVITTAAFTGQASFSGDGGVATLAATLSPQKVVVDRAGNLFTVGFDRLVRRVDFATQTVATVAGNATQPLNYGFTGDGGPATVATLAAGGLAVNATGGLYIADGENNRIRFVQLAPVSVLAPANLAFGDQAAGVDSVPVPVTLTNSGGDDLLISSIVDASSFSQVNNCPVAPAPLAPMQSCTINITFTPTAAGAAADTLVITDNAAGSPHRIPLAGTGKTPFALTTTCTSLTVVPGQSAIYTVDLAPFKGFTQSVGLSCSGAPALAKCTVSPTAMTLDGATTVQAKVTATTTAATTGFLKSPFDRQEGNRVAGLIGTAGVAGLAALVILPGKGRKKHARRLFGLIFCLCMISMVATMSSCGVGGGNADPPGTAAGTYPLTVTGTFKSATGTTFTQQVSFDLVVK